MTPWENLKKRLDDAISAEAIILVLGREEAAILRARVVQRRRELEDAGQTPLPPGQMVYRNLPVFCSGGRSGVYTCTKATVR